MTIRILAKSPSRGGSTTRRHRHLIVERLEDRALLTAGVAELVEDGKPGGGINPGSAPSLVRHLTNVNGTLYFQAFDGTNGSELWRINAGGKAEMVEDAVTGGGIYPGGGNSNPQAFAVANGTLYFQAYEGTSGRELWQINAAGQAELVEVAVAGGGINPGSAHSDPLFLMSVGNTLYFTADDGTNGRELWWINAAGEVGMVEDAVAGGGISPGSGSSHPGQLTNVRGTLYFQATDGTNGYELWRINASSQAEMVEDAVGGGGINPGGNSPGLRYLTDVNGTLFFSATDGSHGRELWRINAASRAEMVEDAAAGGGINPGAEDSDPNDLTIVNGTLYFSADDNTNGIELWRINASGQAVLVEDAVAGGGINPGVFNSEPVYLTNVNGTLYFRALTNSSGQDLWRTTASGQAVKVEDPRPGMPVSLLAT